MQARSPILPVPKGDRYWCTKLEEKGDHWFRFPNFAVSGRVQDWTSACNNDGRGGTYLYSGLMIGVCWWHRSQTFSFPFSIRMDDDAIDAYATAVIEELQEAGYTVGDINRLANPCDRQIAQWLRGQTKVVQAAIANFKMGQEEEEQKKEEQPTPGS